MVLCLVKKLNPFKKTNKPGESKLWAQMHFFCCILPNKVERKNFQVVYEDSNVNLIPKADKTNTFDTKT